MDGAVNALTRAQPGSDSLRITVVPPSLGSTHQLVEGGRRRWRSLFLPWWGRPRPWSAEAGIAGIVDPVILAVRIHVLGVVFVVLDVWQGSGYRPRRQHCPSRLELAQAFGQPYRPVMRRCSSRRGLSTCSPMICPTVRVGVIEIACSNSCLGVLASFCEPRCSWPTPQASQIHFIPRRTGP
jgi:hypothetical protein